MSAMSPLLEPPPLLTLVIVLASALLALWLGLGQNAPLSRFRPQPRGELRPQPDSGDQPGEASETWGVADPVPPPRRPYRYMAPIPLPEAQPPAEAEISLADIFTRAQRSGAQRPPAQEPPQRRS